MTERQITRGTRVALVPIRQEGITDRPLFAINWFNTRSLWLYHFYNAVASRSVFRVGAKVLFKGLVCERLLGSEQSTRQVLLIVNYPSGERLLDLLSDRYFQVTSLLRMAAVRDFSFVLNRRLDGPELLDSRTQPFVPDKAWAVHLYSVDAESQDECDRLRDAAEAANVRLHFASHGELSVDIIDRRNRRKTTPFITDRVVILEADSPESLASCVTEGPYRAFADSVQTSCIARLRRLL